MILFENVILDNPGRFLNASELKLDKVEKAMENAIMCIKKAIPRFENSFPECAMWQSKYDITVNKYLSVDIPDWTSGLWTGMYWILYELTGDAEFRNAAESHIKIYERVARESINLNDHDTGFKFSPSCVAAYKLTGNECAKNAALRAAYILLEHYCQINKFIIRSGKNEATDNYSSYRTLVDSMMNIPLFFWAYGETKEEAFLDAAVGHYETTYKYLIRDDGSSYHHYQFDPVTHAPVGGCTLQGNRDESCWSRGHSWLVYGYPIAYGYTKDEKLFDIHRAVSYYFLNHLPQDDVPYWDFDFMDGSFEPRDASASAIASCGLIEMTKFLSDSDKNKEIFENAANLMLSALIDKCSNKNGNGDGILFHTVGSKPHHMEIDTCSPFGDYFYLEALMRKLKPDWKPYW